MTADVNVITKEFIQTRLAMFENRIAMEISVIKNIFFLNKFTKAVIPKKLRQFTFIKHRRIA